MKQVSRYDLNGNYIDSFESAEEAIMKTGIRHIRSVCTKKRNSAGGYQWRYSNDIENISPIHYRIPKRRKVKVDCYDLKGNFVRTYDSITEASVDNKVSTCSIAGALHGRQRSSAGYVWKFSNEG